MSHELRTPLTAINGWSETLLEDDDPAQLRRGLHIILNESRRLTNMVEELLEFSKMQDGRFTLRIRGTWTCRREFEDAVYTYQELFRQDGIHLEYDDDGELYTDPIPGDPERLSRCCATYWTTPPSTVAPAAHHRLSAAGCGQLYPHPGLRARHPGGALPYVQKRGGLLQGPWQRYRSGGVR